MNNTLCSDIIAKLPNHATEPCPCSLLCNSQQIHHLVNEQDRVECTFLTEYVAHQVWKHDLGAESKAIHSSRYIYATENQPRQGNKAIYMMIEGAVIVLSAGSQ